jgi:hypothetical protein
MKPLNNLTDDEIDALLLHLFNGTPQSNPPIEKQKQRLQISELSDQDLLRIRTRNHPDKWPNVNIDAYQAAVEELDRRRNTR